MSREFSEYTGQFFWSFKEMDNVNYNFAIIETLYKAKKQDHSNENFNKPIIIILLAIIECSLYDFFMRISGHTRDPLPNLKKSIVYFFKSTKETDELKTLIGRIKSQNLLVVKPGDSLYEDLEFLRKIRNRIHIQNRNHELDADKKTDYYKDEYFAYTDEILEKAQDCFEKVIGTLCNVYPRWNKSPLPMIDFPRPWL